MNNETDWYEIIAYIVGFIVFVFVWLSSFEQWGLLLGLMFGWIPALIGATLAGILWPILVIILIIIII